jgi:glycosyltransferase involved in cell wall biosynthesis
MAPMPVCGGRPIGRKFMTTTCLVSNYNYAHYVCDAVDSALRQTVPLDEIIVVDDGSTDGSLELLKSRYHGHPAVRIIAKGHQGQLSCFNVGFAHATGDVVFFLDADDVYEPNYVEQALEVYSRDQNCDFVFCVRRRFPQRDDVSLEVAEDRDLGYSVILTAYFREWIGAPTSCLSMRRRILDKILPIPFTDDWWTRADDCLVFGASLAGARKHYIARPLVRYRVHGRNHFCGRRADKFANYRRRLAINTLFEYLERKLCYNVPRLADFHHREFSTIARPTLRQLTQYVRIGMASRTSLLRRLFCIAEMTGHYLHTAISSSAENHAAPALEHNSKRLLPACIPMRSPADSDASRTGDQQGHAA